MAYTYPQSAITPFLALQWQLQYFIHWFILLTGQLFSLVAEHKVFTPICVFGKMSKTFMGLIVLFYKIKVIW